MVVLVAAVVTGRWRAMRPRIADTADGALTRSVSWAVTVTVAVLFFLLAVSVWTGRAVASPAQSNAVSIAIIGRQWWWEIEYEDETPSQRVTTANEIKLPTDRPIVIKVASRDVIHSFWVPNLVGKRDLIPGCTTAIWLQADRPGVFRGQCAEFCGKQHAHMAFNVVAEPEADFSRWLDAERQLATDPRTEEELRCREVFMAARCSSCHRIRGTDAGGQLAPDLTHVASRRMLGAGMLLPNAHEQLANWVVNPQATKPGNQMPPNALAAGDLNALVAYLELLG